MYNTEAKLVLENGRIFFGYAFGHIGITTGEVCFNTGMTGYQEILTDPSYSGQLITMTYPHIGNYGINNEDVESNKIQASGFIVKDGSSPPSNFRSQDSIENYLKINKIVGIQGLDTRALVRCIRKEGAMNGIISSTITDENELKIKLENHPSMIGLDLAKEVTCKESFQWGKKKGDYKIAVIDYGIKYNILRLLEKQGFQLTVFPATVQKDELISFNPDGIFLSNGPGDPAAVSYSIQTVKEIINRKIPIFGICLGHQILALAMGAKTYKLKFGHRGCNHPVKNHKTEKIEITSQNHGFSVDLESLPDNIEITHTSLNDNTVEGISIKNYPAFSVQYHPESSPGPHDSRYLFKKFKDLIIYRKDKKIAKAE
jgi:carbamoyl-phosphate synthase small subunit